MLFVPLLLGGEVEALHVVAVVVLHLKGIHGKDALWLLQGIVRRRENKSDFTSSFLTQRT